MLGSPEETEYDLRFRLFNVPVRVHPLFWLVMVFLSGQNNSIGGVLIFTACAFVSILVHEFGHGLAARAFGNEPTGIVLYAMGGLCMFSPGRQTPLQRLIVLASGPGAGFVLLGLVLAFALARYGVHPLDALALFGIGPGDSHAAALRLFFQSRGQASPELAIFFLVEINLLWGLLNLLPIWPLDGGQIASTVLGVVSPRSGVRWAHVLSLVTAGLLAAWWFSPQTPLMALWFAYFGFINYQAIQSIDATHRSFDRGGW